MHSKLLVATRLLARLSSRFSLGTEDLDEWLAVELMSEYIERAKISKYIAQPTIDSRLSRLHVTILGFHAVLSRPGPP